MNRRMTLWLMVIVLLAAALLRLPALTAFPPGLHYDEAANAILAGDIGLRGARPIFIASYTGKETLFFYLAGGVVRLVGESVFSLRLTAAFVGLLTVAVAYRLGLILLRDRRAAVVAALLLAASFWHLVFSRLGFRAITQPLLQGLTVWWLFVACGAARSEAASRRPGVGATVAAGMLLGLTGYTYLAARLFPFVLLLGTLPLWRRHWRRLLAIGAVGLVVLAPLLAYFAGQPDAFWVRIGQVAPSAESLGLGESLLRSLGMFFVAGDPYVRFNLPGRPLFGPLLGALLLMGWGLGVWRLRVAADDRQRAARLTLLLAPLIMLLPSALAVNEIVPSNLRALGMLPFLMLLPADAMISVLDRLRPLPARAFAGLALALLLGLGWLGYRATFVDWGPRADLFYENDGDLVAAAGYVDALPSGEATFIAARHYRHPTVAFLSARYDELLWLPGATALVLPAEGTATYIFPFSAPLPDWAASYLAGATVEDGPLGPDGAPAFRAYRLAEMPGTGLAPRAQDFGGILTLNGVETGAGPSGGALPATLAWTVRAAPGPTYEPFVHLEDAWGHRWSEGGDDGYPSEQWQPGDRLILRSWIPVPAGTPPGEYTLRTGWFERASGERLPVLDAEGRFAGSGAAIAGARVLAASPPATAPSPPVAADPAAGTTGLRLLGYDALPATAPAGGRLEPALWWEASAPLPDWRERFVLLSTGRETVPLAEGLRPVHDTLPFATWSTPALIVDRQSLQLPPELPAGDYQLLMTLVGDEGEVVLSQSLADLTVEASNMETSAPPLQEPIDADFGGEIRLLGADRRGELLTLVWQAWTVPGADYTVFVHLLDEDGVCCLWQADAWPQNGSSATSTWIPGSIVEDTYTVVPPDGLPSGLYPLEVGLYVAEDGRRLPVERQGGGPPDAVLLDPWFVP